MVLERRSEDGVILAAGGIPRARREHSDRRGAYRALFRARLNQAAIDDTRLALNQNQPLGNSRFMTKIARMTGERREARPRGRPRKDSAAVGTARG